MFARNAMGHGRGGTTEPMCRLASLLHTTGKLWWCHHGLVQRIVGAPLFAQRSCVAGGRLRLEFLDGFGRDVVTPRADAILDASERAMGE